MASAKNKNIILGGVVVILWGAIAFKIVKHFNESRVVELPNTNVFKTAGIKVKKEKFTIDHFYKDPFLKDLNESSTRINNENERNLNKIEFQPFKPQVNWPVIDYNGIVESSDKSKKVGLMQVEKKSYLIYEGDSVEHINIMKIFKDSLKLKFKNEEKVIPLQK